MQLVPLSGPTDGFSWRAPLPPYQKAGIARLLASPGVLLADEMGLSKTIQTIGALLVLLRYGSPGPVPTGLVLQWRRQFREWAPELALSTCIGAPEERRQRWLAQVYLTGFDATYCPRRMGRGDGCGRSWLPTRRNASRMRIPPSLPRSKTCPGIAPGR